MRTVNPARIRRYLDRTLTEPARSMVLTVADIEEVQRQSQMWIRNEDMGPLHPVTEWQREVERWAKVKGKRVSWMSSVPTPANTQLAHVEQTVSWELR